MSVLPTSWMRLYRAGRKTGTLTDSLYEGLIGMSFDSMYDSFISSLMDMEKSAEDFADDISKYFMQACRQMPSVNSLVTN